MTVSQRDCCRVGKAELLIIVLLKNVDRCQQLIESSPQMDEENTKVKLVQPFLQLLGWNLYSTEVALV